MKSHTLKFKTFRINVYTHLLFFITNAIKVSISYAIIFRSFNNITDL